MKSFSKSFSFSIWKWHFWGVVALLFVAWVDIFAGNVLDFVQVSLALSLQNWVVTFDAEEGLRKEDEVLTGIGSWSALLLVPGIPLVFGLDVGG